MPRTIDVHAPADHIDCLIERLNGVDGIVSLSRSPGASLDPAGDRLTLTVTNDAMRPLFGIFEELRTAYAGTVSTSEVASLIARDKQSIIDREDNETVWDEMAFLLRSDTNLSVNYLLAMPLAGAIAAAGLWADTIHVIVGAMIIAPTFEPLARLPFGLIIGSPNWPRMAWLPRCGATWH